MMCDDQPSGRVMNVKVSSKFYSMKKGTVARNEIYIFKYIYLINSCDVHGYPGGYPHLYPRKSADVWGQYVREMREWEGEVSVR